MFIFVFGDSTTYGAWDRGGGWTTRLKLALAQKIVKKEQVKSDYSIGMIYELGVDSDSTSELLDRFENELRARIALLAGEEVLVIFQIGTNDACRLNKKKFERTDTKTFEANINKLIAKSKSIANHTAFLGLIPVDEKKTDPVYWNDEHSFLNKNILAYNSIISRACEKKGVIFIDLYSKFVRSGYTRLLFDGLHPNSSGHEKIFKTVYSRLKNEGIDVFGLT
ncbi:MAG: GDSL-type esterase/lipase family protein [Candidatus Micrarchaeales archaeon]|jgi:lysophospholipase L1-like esterase